MSVSPIGPQQAWPHFGLLVGAHCLGAMNLLVVLACAPLISAEFGYSAVEIGLIASAYALGITLLSIPAGRCSDMVGVRGSLFLAGWIMAAGVMVFASAQSIGPALGGMLLIGCGYSLVNPAAGRAVMLWYPASIRATLMGIKQTGVPLGGALGTSAALLAPILGWQVVVVATGAVTAACGLAFLFLPREHVAYQVPRVTVRSELSAIWVLLRNPVLGRNNLASGLNNGAQFILWTHLIEFLRLGAGFGLPLANACLSLSHICSIGGRVFWGWATDWFFRAEARQWDRARLWPARYPVPPFGWCRSEIRANMIGVRTLLPFTERQLSVNPLASYDCRMQRSGRLLLLLQTLRERRRAVTARSLAQQFGVSERTIYRDMKTLLVLGVPVEGEPGTGFILRPGFFLPSMAFTRDEADALLLGLRFVRARGDSEIAKAADTALLKVTDGMGDHAEAQMMQNGLTVGPPEIVRQDALRTIRRAMRDHWKLKIAYRTDGRAPNCRVVWPVALGFFDKVEMLAAWCELRTAFRHFRIDRLDSLTVLKVNTPRSRNSLLADYRKREPDANL
ncbi:MFS transporter [Roseinatronobacter alkalisoli]|uniref:MFS transporter n=1 Tax=Roseinatronobacter alkalisoli TaxID=3028235 RepID=A0ABT5T6W2_9RHOB|nr:MFS transporter [Roseinatronobacter sp. HJB301]MDD7970856.1 MFS transporter [Roseinatronobacter sp. HJB301]